MRVNMDSSIVSDPRFKLAAQTLNVNWKEVIGACFLVWTACYDRRSTCLRKIEADLAAELSGFSDALIGEKLADDMGDGVVRIHGVEKRIEFLLKQAESGSKGGKSKGKKDGKRVQKKKQASAQAPASSSAQANTLTPSPDLSPDLDHSLTPADAPTKRSPVSRAMLEQVYDRYPKKTGKAKGLAKAKLTIIELDDFELFEACVEEMHAGWKGHDTQFCPGFEPFINGKRWQDGDLPMPNNSGSQVEKPKDRAQELWDRSEQMRLEEEAADVGDPKEGAEGPF